MCSPVYKQVLGGAGIDFIGFIKVSLRSVIPPQKKNSLKGEEILKEKYQEDKGKAGLTCESLPLQFGPWGPSQEFSSFL